MISKPIVAPVKGDKLRASWGAAVAERANECADAIDVLRGPGGLSSQREPKAAKQPSLYPLKVLFVPSDEEGASPVDGDLIVYMPPGSLSVNGHATVADDVPLTRYTSGAYESEPDWYQLPFPQEDCTVQLSFSFRPLDDPPLSLYISVGNLESFSTDDEPGEISRDITLAHVTVVQPSQGVTGGVTVRQVTKGPAVYEFGVRSLNGAMGDLSVVGGGDGVEIDGTTYYVKANREEDSSEIVVSLSNDGPGDEDGDGDGYCNDISDEDDDGVGNDISDDVGGDGGGGDDNTEGDGNAISLWPCNNGEGDQES